MLLRLLSSLTLIVALMAPSSAKASDPETMSILQGRAENFVDCLLKGSVNSIAGEMSPSLRQTYTNEVVKTIFGDMHERGGRFEGRGETTLSIGRNTSVTALIPLHYSRQKVNARVVFERAGRHSKVSEFAILPFAEPDPATLWHDPNAGPRAVRSLPSPPYANAMLFRAETIEIAREGLSPLAANLYMPTIATSTSPVPTVILLTEATASGAPPMVGGSNPTRDLAEGLATKGVAVMVIVPDVIAAEIVEESVEADAVQAIAEPVSPITEDFWMNLGTLIQAREEIDVNRLYTLAAGSTLLQDPPRFYAVGRIAIPMTTDDPEDGGLIMPKTTGMAMLASHVAQSDAAGEAGAASNETVRAYAKTGPYLIDEIEDGETIRYGHVKSAVIDDLATLARTGRMPVMRTPES